MQKQITLTTSPQPSFGTVATVAHPAGTTLGIEQLSPDTWSIVLAGGEGERLRVLTKRWLGAHRPKQYCAFVGNRSMLQHTLDRAVVLSGTDRTLVVVARQHAPDVWEHLDKIHWEQTILQPRNCGTGPGIFLPLAHIHFKNPEAIVLILPSDHFVFPEAGFLAALQRVVAMARRLTDKLVLLGAHADRPETEYGWIEPGLIIDRVDGRVVRKVKRFREKPNQADAETLGRIGKTPLFTKPLVVPADSPGLHTRRAAARGELGRRDQPGPSRRRAALADSIAGRYGQRAHKVLAGIIPGADIVCK